MGAAPACMQARKGTVVAAGALTALFLLAAAPTAARASMPSSVWAIEPASGRLSRAELDRFHRQGLNAVVVSGPRRASVAAAVRRRGFVAVAPHAQGGTPLRTLCRVARHGPTRTCAVLVTTPRAAVASARRNVADFVVVRLRTLGQLRMLRGVRARTHILAVAQMPKQGLARKPWQRALTIVQQDPTLDLAVAVSSTTSPALRTYVGLMATARAQKQAAGTDPGGDALAPSAPLTLSVGATTPSTVTLSWPASTDNVGVAGYEISRNGTAVASTTLTTFTVPGLACSTSYSFAVSAYDAAGNHSAKTSVNATTAQCGAGDGVSPSTPTGLTKVGASATVISISWSASSDNIGVAGYGVYRGGTLVSTTSSTSTTVTGLTCGTSYALAVDAYDAAGNRSGKATLTASTGACTGDTQAPTTPTAVSVTSSTATSISLTWGASTDNVAVASYGLYRNGSGAGSSSGTSATVSGLTCGTSYTLGVDAADAAGNRSGKATVSASTASCGGGSSSASVFLSPSGSDGNPCSQSQPCLSFDRAYQVAVPGATVEVAAGTYGMQTINEPQKSSPDVVFRPAAGAAVTLGDIDVTSGAHIEFRDFTLTQDSYNRQNAQYITWRRISMRDFFVRGADHISYIDSDVGPNTGADEMNWITAPYQSTDPASDILLDDVTIHDFTKHMSGSHVDCIGIDDVDGLTIRNSHISRCAHFSIIFGNDTNSGRAARNVLLENNFLDCCDASGGGYYSIGFGGIDGNVMIRYNSADLGFGWLNDTSLVPNGLITIDSNVIDNNNSANCSRATWTYNVVASGSACGGTLAATGFVSPPDLHIAAGSAAVNAGNPTSYPAADIDGHPRPAGGRPDAGASEIG
jgi:chitodextrinase